jgi:hypothetical protein
MAREPVVAVVWDDADVEPTKVQTRDQFAKSVLVRFILFGVVVRDDDQVLGIASEITADGCRQVTMIPRGLVREVVPVGVWPPRRRKAPTVPTPADPPCEPPPVP